MSILVFDFETQDPYIGWGAGAGWVYYLKHGNSSKFRNLGVAVYDPESGYEEYITDKNKAKRLFKKYDTLVAHNSQYDLGCLLCWGIDIDNFTPTQ